MTSTFVQLALVAFVVLAAGRASGEPAINQRGVAQSSNELSQFVNSEALTALDGFDAGRGLALNTKRAKGKMSAFMPMRGRRFDGGVAELATGRDGDSPADFLRSAVAMAVQQQQQQRQPAINPMPRQFVEQLRMRAPAAFMIRGRPTLIDQLSVDTNPADLMEAKFRRAFHPMRGKRDGLDGDLDQDLDDVDVMVA